MQKVAVVKIWITLLGLVRHLDQNLNKLMFQISKKINNWDRSSGVII